MAGVEDETGERGPQRSAERRLSRRALLRRGALLGLGTPVLGVLAACGGTRAGAPAASAVTSTTAAPGVIPASPAAAVPSAGPIATPAALSSAGFAIEPVRHRGGRVVEGAFVDAQTLNPVLADDAASQRVIDLMFNAIMTADPATTIPAGDLARAWEVSTDGLTYTFTLQDGVTWHDGQPLTAHDVAFTYGLLMNPATGSPRTAELVARVRSIDAVDDHTAKVVLLAPDAAFLVSSMAYPIVPEHILGSVNPAGLAQHPFSTGKPGVTVGSGPFTFAAWVKGAHVTLSRYAGYFRGAPSLDQYQRSVLADSSTVAQQLAGGQVDYGEVDPSDVDTLRQVPALNLSVYDTFSFTFYAYQLDPARSTVFQDRAVRQALFYAIDRQAMLDAVRFGIGEVALGTIPSLSWAYNPQGLTTGYGYDVNRATQLLDQAGWTAGPDGIRARHGQKLAFTLYTNAGNQVRGEYVTMLVDAWKQIGVDCTAKTEEWTAFLDRITNTHDFDMFLVGFQWDVDPDQSVMWATDSYHGGFNMNRYSNPQVDQLLRAGLATTDRARRRALYTQLQNLVLEDLPSPILDFPRQPAAVNRRVHNLIPNAVRTTFNAHQWWVDG
ncbi:MAG TPA: ABC transporter substrate-binding protein [Thermomicrobiaceae bacterium]|nr:ABC transporter substrate-binding protein [Thermomicrobiaceae bacterium]